MTLFSSDTNIRYGMIFLLTVVFFSLSSCPADAITNIFPGSEWATTTPEAVGLDSAKLDIFVNAIDNSGSAAGVIVKDGYIVKTWGSQSIKFDWASAAKPVISTMLFFAIDEGLLSSVSDLIYGFDWVLTAADQTMTFHHLANMTSGYARSEDPGIAWAYNDYGIQLYVKTLFDRVFETTPNAAATDSSRLGALQLDDGTLFSSRSGYGMSTTPRTFARIGWLWLNKGNWNGVQILPQSFFDTYMNNQVPADLSRTSAADADYLGVGTYGGGSDQTSFGPGFYGYGWWFNTNQEFWPDAPADTFQANGHFGTEVLTVIPSLNLVVAAKGTWGGYEPGDPESTMNQNLKLLVEAVQGATVTLDSFTTPTADDTPAVTGTASGGNETISSVEYQLDSIAGSWTLCDAVDGTFNETNETFSCSTSQALEDGSYTMYIRATNAADDESEAESMAFIVDTVAASLSITVLSPDPTNDRTPSITGFATDTASIIDSVEYQIDGTSGSWNICTSADGGFDETTEEFSCTVDTELSLGTHVLYVRATDEAGNMTASSSYVQDTFTVSGSQDFTQTDWSGGDGQSSWSNTTKFSSSNNIATSTTGQISLAPTNDGGAPWYEDSWQYRKQITLNADQISGTSTLSNFPVLIKNTDSDIAQHARADGFDIIFTLDDGTTKLDHEIERYSTSTEELIAWVRIPALSATANTALYIYYGNEAASNQQNAAGVWDANYQGVWHLNETSGNRSDSTVKANTLTDVNTVPQAGGQIGYGTAHDNTLPESLTRTNANLNADFPGKATITAFTASAWANFDQLNTGHTHNLIVKGTTFSNFMYVESKTVCFSFGTGACAEVNTIATSSTWYYLTTTYDGDNVRLYINGVQSGANHAQAPIAASTRLLTVGKREDNITTRALDGKLDEVRMSNSSRSADWILTEYNNQYSPETFYSSGAAQQNTGYATSGTLVSSVFDVGEGGVWGDLTYTATTSSDTDASVKVRTSNSGTMAGAPDFDSCTTITNGADMSSNNCVTDGNQYIQYEVTLETSDSTQTPLFQDITLEYTTSVISPTVLLNSLTSPDSDNTPVVTGTATDEDGVITAIEYQIDGTSGSWSACIASDGSFNEISEDFTCSESDGVSDGSHTFNVRVNDEDGLSDEETVTFFIDTVAPAGVSAPTFEEVTSSSVTIGRPTATENGSGLYQWQVRRNEVAELGFLATSTVSMGDSSLSENTEYTYDVQFKDVVGNISDYGTAAQKYTLVNTPTDLIASSAGTGSITLQVDNFPHDTADMSGYYFSRAGSNSGWIQTNTWQDTGLSCGTAYTFEVMYRNGEGVESDTISLSRSTDACPSEDQGDDDANDDDVPACADESDNDGDGITDYPHDIGCESEDDTDETNADTPDDDPSGGSANRSRDDEDSSRISDSQANTDTSDALDPGTNTPDTDVESLVSKLKALIKEFVAQGGNLSPELAVYVTPSFSYTRDLTLESRGSDVRQLQSFLIVQNKGPAARALAAIGSTGYFGVLTRNALAQYQATVGILPAAGYFGPITRIYITGL